MSSLTEQIERTPVTFVIAFAYLALALLTDPIDPTGSQLVEYGSCNSVLLYDEPWRLLSYAFLHGGIVHLMFNLYCLVIIGPIVELSLGRAKYVVLYVVGAVGGATVAMIWDSGSIVGGSGSLFAMFGAIVAANMRGGRHLFDAFQFRGPRSILILIAINFVIGFIVPRVSNSGHAGGLLSGFVVTFLFLDRGRSGAPDTIGRVVQAGWVAVLVSLSLYVMRPVGHTWFTEFRDDLQAVSRTRVEADLEEAVPVLRDAILAWHDRVHGR